MNIVIWGFLSFSQHVFLSIIKVLFTLLLLLCGFVVSQLLQCYYRHLYAHIRGPPRSNWVLELFYGKNVPSSLQVYIFKSTLNIHALTIPLFFSHQLGKNRSYVLTTKKDNLVTPFNNEQNSAEWLIKTKQFSSAVKSIKRDLEVRIWFLKFDNHRAIWLKDSGFLM